MEIFNETVNGSAGAIDILRAAGAFLFIFLVPGLAWSFVFFKKVHLVERCLLAIGLSLALVTLATIALNIVLNIPITEFSLSLVVITLTGVAGIILVIIRLLAARKQGPPPAVLHHPEDGTEENVL